MQSKTLTVAAIAVLLAAGAARADVSYNDGGIHNVRTALPVGKVSLSNATTLNVLAGGALTGAYGSSLGQDALYTTGNSPANVYDGGSVTGGEGGSNGGYAIKASGSPVTVNGGIVTGGVGGTWGGAAIYPSGGSLTVHGGTITGGAGWDSGGSGAYAITSVVDMDGGTVRGGSAQGGGDGILAGDSTLTLRGGVVAGGAGESLYGGTGLRIYGSSLSIYAGTISAGTGPFPGGAGIAADNSTINVYGGAITGGEHGGHGLTLKDSCTVNIYAGTIAAGSGGDAIRMATSNPVVCRLNIYGGTIQGGSGTPAGRGIQASGGAVVYIHGGSITASGTGLYAKEDGAIYLFGSGFNYPLGPISATSGTLTGTLQDGSALNLTFSRYPEAQIILVPEPAMLSLLALGALAALRRRSGQVLRRRRRVSFGAAVVIAAALLPFAAPSLSQAESAYPVAWWRQIDTSVPGTTKSDGGDAVAVDASGNAYMSGTTQGYLGGPVAGGHDAFLVKYNGSGTQLWARQIGPTPTGIAAADSVGVDASGNAYIGGYTNGNVGGTNAGMEDSFLVKYSSSGNVLWSRQFGTSSEDRSWGMAVDASGNAYLSGGTGGDLGGTNAGGSDAFLVKYDASGNQLWARQIGSSSNDDARSVAVDASGNVYITGETWGSLAGTSAGNTDIFLAKYDGSGNLLWSRQIGTSAHDGSSAVTVDASGNAFIGGWTGGDLGGTNAGGADAFLTKYDGSGNQLWMRQFGTSHGEASSGLAVDASGNAYVTGYTGGSLGGASAGCDDVFLVKYDGSGNLIWSAQTGTTTYDDPSGLALDAAGNVYVSGTTGGTMLLSSNYDAFLVKFQVPEPGSAVSLSVAGLAVLARRWRKRAAL